jgi:hypothetical protein
MDKFQPPPLKAHYRQMHQHLMHLAMENNHLKAQLAGNCMVPPGFLGHNSADTADAKMTLAPATPPGIFEPNNSKAAPSVKSPDNCDDVKRSNIVPSAAGTEGGKSEKKEGEAVSNAKESAARPGARDLRVEKSCDGSVNFHWPVDVKKLSGKDSQILSPGFDILPGSSFKMMLRPDVQNFKKSNGYGSVELKMIDGSPEMSVLKFRIRVGGLSPTELVEHDFSKNNIAGSANKAKRFDFKSAVDEASPTLLITLEVIVDPSPPESNISPRSVQ